MPTNRKFNGNIDDGFGLLDFSARQYNPLLGRFISADTVVPGAGNPQNLNRYSYVGNSPLNFTDPTGHCAANYASGDAWCREEWASAENIHDYGEQLQKQVKAGDLKPVEALAKLSDRTAAIFNSSMDDYMWAMTLVLMGIDAITITPFWFYSQNDWDAQVKTINARGWSHYWLKKDWLPYNYDKNKSNDSTVSDVGDWNEGYFDGSANQAYHFWAYVSTRYYNGDIFSSLSNFIHDNPLRVDRPGVSISDNKLGLAGIELGYQLGNPSVSCWVATMQCSWVNPDPGNWIRTHLKS
jgi:RHS repeat-associated protein